ncbi:MAG: NADH-quinone oxidoreductase subunit I [Acidobacteriota bacterium]
MPTVRRKLSDINPINVTDRTEAEHTRRNSIIATLRGLGVTFTHFIEQIGGKTHATIEYPEQRRNYSNRFRGAHILTQREDGSIKCVACYLCATACPAECIYIEAAESTDTSIEKYAARFEIDMMRCIYCGFCVDACPEEAIIMSRQSELAAYSRPETVWGIDKLMQRPELPQYGTGYRPNYPPQYPLLESQLPFKPVQQGAGDQVHSGQSVGSEQELLPGGPIDLKRESYLRSNKLTINANTLAQLPALEAQGQRGEIKDLEREKQIPETDK